MEISRAFGARLSLLHNQDAAPLGLSRAWDWQASHREASGRSATVESGLRELLASLPEGLAADATVSRGLIVPAILALARQPRRTSSSAPATVRAPRSSFQRTSPMARCGPSPTR